MINITLIFIVITVATGLVWLLDFCVLRRRRVAAGVGPHAWVELVRSMFPVLLVVLCVRSFLVQPYRVPTGSLVPTVLPGEFIFVNQFAYGLRLPLMGRKLVAVGEPKRGDLVLFYWPPDPEQIYVKRVVGLPGDHLAYHHKVLFVNGVEA